MKNKEIFAITYGLSLLSEDEMRDLLFKAMMYETDGKLEKAVEFVFDFKVSVNNKMLEKLRPQD
jgi:hypothetical protein